MKICRRALLLSCLLTTLCSLHSTAAGQSTRFRGPNGDGQYEADAIPATWTAKDYNWRIALPGVGHSSPVVLGPRLFVTCADEDSATLSLCCLDTSDGRIVWKQSFPSTTYAKNGFNSYAATTPALDDRRVYLTWATPEQFFVVALDQNDGRELWRVDLGGFKAQHGFGGSPVVFDGLVIVANDQDGPSFVIALDSATGKTRWKSERRTESAAYSTPCIFQPEGQPPQLILTSWAHGINALDPTTGAKLWEQALLKFRVCCSPVIASGLIFTSCGTGGSGKQMVAIRPGIPGQGIEAELAYEIEGSLPYVPTSVACGPLLFLWSDSGVVTCLDSPTGKVVWRQRVGGNYFGSPVRVGRRIYCMSREGRMIVMAAADKYQLLADIDLEEPSQATPVVADGVMYLRTYSHLMSLGGKAQ